MMGSPTLLVVAACLIIGGAQSSHILDSMPDVVDELWKKTSSNWIIVTGSHLAAFFDRYALKQKKQLSLFEKDFISGDANWQKDFSEFGMTVDFSRAYFRQFDVIRGFLWLRLTIEDMDSIIDTCDRATGGTGLGYLTGSQFKKGFKEVIFRKLPFALLFVRTLDVDSPVLNQGISPEKFNNILRDIDKDGDGEVTAQDFGKFWDAGSYGAEAKGMDLFKRLDYQHCGHINQTHWDILFDDLNCRPGEGKVSGNSRISYDEFVQLDLILEGIRPYPSNDCGAH